MFKITPNPTFAGLVNITVPGADKPAVLQVTWRHMGRAALAQWLRKPGSVVAPAAIEPAPALADQAADPAAQDATWLTLAMANWAGPQDADGAPVPFSQVALANLLDAYPAAGGELLAAYLAAMTESRSKN